MKGLYIHIPFCSKKCPYCDFFSAVGFDDLKEKYLAALCAELRLYADEYDLSGIETLYFGGGTPSSIKPTLYESFFSCLSEFLNLEKLSEITIEVNPESYSPDDFKHLREIGFSRVSIGVQSFLDENLRCLGRTHSSEVSLKAIENAHRSGFENISVDLIWGLPNQTEEKLRKEFEVLKRTPAVHLSAYKLTVYEETPLAKLVRWGKFDLPSEEQIENLYFTLLEEAGNLGFKRYEISNFAKTEKFRSRHNLLYWKLEPFLGLGASAWSFDLKHRWANVADLKVYIEKTLKGEKPLSEFLELNERDLLKERIIMGLRTTEGVEKKLIEGKLPEEYLEEFFVRKGEKVAFNDRGFLISNYLLSEIISKI